MKSEPVSLKTDVVFSSNNSYAGQRKNKGVDDENKSGSFMGEVEKPLSDTELLRIMECPVCNEFPAPPIYSCEKGHFTCNSCMELLEACSLCEAPYTKVRNFALESIIESSKFKCRNAYLGCPLVVAGADLNNHVANCKFRPLDCKELECLRKNLAPNEYLQHIIEQHGIQGCDKKLIDGRTDILLNQIEGSPEYHPYYVKILGPDGDTTFIIRTLRHRTFMCWWAVCLDPSAIDGYQVCFSLESKPETQELLSVRWTLPLQPAWKDFDEIISTGRCAVLPDTNLLAFFVDDKSWNLKVEVVKLTKQSPSKQNNDYYFLILLVLFGILAVVLAKFVESGFDWFSIKSEGIQNLNQSFVAPEKHDQEYFGYRGFYYKV